MICLLNIVVHSNMAPMSGKKFLFLKGFNVTNMKIGRW